jgi:hypothetical protein
MHSRVLKNNGAMIYQNLTDQVAQEKIKDLTKDKNS